MAETPSESDETQETEETDEVETSRSSDPPEDEPAENAASPNEPDAKKPFFYRWMAYAALLAVATGIPAGLWYYQYSTTWMKRPPKVEICFEGLRSRLKEPVIVSPSEPYLDRTKNETVYLTENQYRAVQCTETLTEGAPSRLAQAYAEPDFDKQAAALAAAVRAAPEGPKGDKEAVGMWMLASSSIEALPKTPARTAAEREADQFVGCRFDHARLPQCISRPPFPVGIYLLGGVGTFSLALVLASVLQSSASRVAARKAKPTPKKA